MQSIQASLHRQLQVVLSLFPLYKVQLVVSCRSGMKVMIEPYLLQPTLQGTSGLDIARKTSRAVTEGVMRAETVGRLFHARGR